MAELIALGAECSPIARWLLQLTLQGAEQWELERRQRRQQQQQQQQQQRQQHCFQDSSFDELWGLRLFTALGPALRCTVLLRLCEGMRLELR